MKTIITEIGELRPGKNRDSLEKEISDALDQLGKIAERIPAHSRWRQIARKASAARKALESLIKRVHALNDELVADDQKYQSEKKSGPTHPVFYDSDLSHLSRLTEKLEHHAALTIDTRRDELKYKCAQHAYAVMIEYSNEKPSRTREGKFQTIAGHFFAAVENANGANAVSMVRACNRALDELT